jgi:tetratricopeptide (TPR) repeat protein
MPRVFSTLFCFAGLAGLLVSLIGCANPLNVGHYQRYMDLGGAAEQRGDYTTARRCYVRSRNEAVAGFLGKGAESAALYNWARMDGMLGDFKGAEQGLKEALRLEDEVYGVGGGHASMRWFELARLYYAWGRYQDSVAAYEQAFPLADRHDARKSDPLTYAACLRDFADALDQTGASSRAQQEREKAASIREQAPSPKILHYPRKASP